MQELCEDLLRHAGMSEMQRLMQQHCICQNMSPHDAQEGAYVTKHKLTSDSCTSVSGAAVLVGAASLLLLAPEPLLKGDGLILRTLPCTSPNCEYVSHCRQVQENDKHDQLV